MKVWSDSRLSPSAGRTKGPRPSTVYPMATTEVRKVVEVAPRWPKRTAAQISKGKSA